MPRSTRLTEAERVSQLYVQIYAVVRRIPRGKVATYGQVAELAGIPGGARVAGAALKVSRPRDRLPWQRVVGKSGSARGRIAIHDPVGAAIQRGLLAKEGIRISDAGHIALDVHGWLPPRGHRRRKRGRSSAKPEKRLIGRSTRSGRKFEL